MNTYNGWSNKETWLVNIWYMDMITEMLQDSEATNIDADELKNTVIDLADECEEWSSLPVGLFGDFIRTCWAEVNWHELAEHINLDLDTEEA